MLTACHPFYSAEKRIVVFARLAEEKPLANRTPDPIGLVQDRRTTGSSLTTSRSMADDAQQRVTRAYDRLARIYDLYDTPMDWLGVRRRRRRLLGRAWGRALEIGIGTGRNLPLYPSGVGLTGIDISEGMLGRARHRARRHLFDVELQLADAQRLPFEDDSFDTVTATCVFCSVADPVQGLREAARVCSSEGRVLLLEHVRPRNRLLGWLADRLSPLTRRLLGPEINRRTEENVAAAGLEIVDILRGGVWREIEARPVGNSTGRS